MHESVRERSRKSAFVLLSTKSKLFRVWRVRKRAVISRSHSRHSLITQRLSIHTELNSPQGTMGEKDTAEFGKIRLVSPSSLRAAVLQPPAHTGIE